MKTKNQNQSWIQSTKLPTLRTALLCWSVLALLALAAGPSLAQTYTILHNFGTNAMGLWPYGALVQGPNGMLYGTAYEGGAASLGQVFKVNADGSGYTPLKDFTASDGVNPNAGLVLSGTTLYGATLSGGANGWGTVFKLQTDGSGFQVLKAFDRDNDGCEPSAKLALSGSTLYGAAASGGATGSGTIFKLNTDGSGFAVLHAFNDADGATPYATPLVAGSALYGTTFWGGSSGGGTVFKLNTDGTGFVVLRHLAEADGTRPNAGLVLLETTLYGTATEDGMNDRGTVFKLESDGSGFTVLKNFAGGDGAWPSGELLLSGTTLYGVTANGGDADSGTVFKLQTDGSGFVVLKELALGDGEYPYGGLVLSNSTLYGLASEGGRYDCGSVYKLQTDGSDFQTLLSFEGGDGSIPLGGWALAGNTFYGTTSEGGQFVSGTIYRISSPGTDYALLASFNRANGANPNGSLVLAGDMLYGTTWGAGASNGGTVFRLNTDGSGLTVLKHLDEQTGYNPAGGLVFANNTLYGTTTFGGTGGGANGGTIFKLAADGSAFTVLKNCSPADGCEPQGRLVLVGTTLYGTATYGGGAGGGTVFRINVDGSDYVILKNLAGSDGSNPSGSLVRSGNTLFGTTSGGGFGYGVLFKLNLDGSGFAVLKRFAGWDGNQPDRELCLFGTTLYGTSGGGYYGWGTIFSIETDGSQFATLKHFYAPEVWSSQRTVLFSGGNLYGTTGGGALNKGAIFRLAPGAPTIEHQPEDQAVNPGAAAVFQVAVTAWPAATYEWFFNGTNLIGGATDARLELTDLQYSQTGNYSVVASNSYGNVTSLVARLIINDPFISAQPTDVTADAGQPASFSVTAGGASALSFQWRKDGTPLPGATNASLTFAAVAGADAGGYDVVVSDLAGSVTSVVARLTVNDPFISTQPTDVTANVGQAASLSVTAGGSSTVSFQWRKDGTPLPGATSATLTFAAVSGADAGRYDVVVSDLAGSVTSRVAWLTVNLALADALAPSLNGGVSCLAETVGGKILVGGGFSLAGGQPRIGLARLNTNGTVDHTFQSALGPNAGVQGLAIQPDGRIVVVGDFAAQPGPTPRYLCRVSADGVLDTTFDTGAATQIFCVAVQPDGKIIVGTYPECFAAAPRWVVRLNADGSVDSTFTAAPDSVVTCLALQPDGRILIAGGFKNVNGQPRNRVARLNPDGTLDGTFVPSPDPYSANSAAYSLALQPDGKVLVGGWPIFGNGDQVRANLARLNPDGTLDAAFNPNVNDAVGAITVQRDGAILIGGPFSAIGGTPRHNLARLHSDGTIDPYFAPEPNGQARALLENADGTILVGGWFTVLAGQPRTYVGRLEVYEPPHPVIYPALQTAETGAPVRFEASGTGALPTALQWRFAGQPINRATNAVFALRSASMTDAGDYTVVASNIAGIATSASALLNVIAPVERRMVPGVVLGANTGSSLNLEYADRLATPTPWQPLAAPVVTSPSQYYFDVSLPLPPQRFYRAWQDSPPSVTLALDLHVIPALTLTGSIGSQVRLEGINQFGPTDAWFNIATVTLTNTSQLYFDSSAVGQPQRLYRVVPAP